MTNEELEKAIEVSCGILDGMIDSGAEYVLFVYPKDTSGLEKKMGTNMSDPISAAKKVIESLLKKDQ